MAFDVDAQFFLNIFDDKKEVRFFFKLGLTNFSSLSKDALRNN